MRYSGVHTYRLAAGLSRRRGGATPRESDGGSVSVDTPALSRARRTRASPPRRPAARRLLPFLARSAHPPPSPVLMRSPPFAEKGHGSGGVCPRPALTGDPSPGVAERVPARSRAASRRAPPLGICKGRGGGGVAHLGRRSDPGPDLVGGVPATEGDEDRVDCDAPGSRCPGKRQGTSGRGAAAPGASIGLSAFCRGNAGKGDAASWGGRGHTVP